MNETMQLIACIVAVLFVVLLAIRMAVGTLKFMYEWAPVVVFLGAIAAICYCFDSDFQKNVNWAINETKGLINADYTEPTETQSGYSTSGNERNNNEILYPVAPRSKGIED